MKYLLLLICMMSSILQGQDSAAKSILDKVSNKYDNYSSVEIDLSMTVHYPDHEETNQEVKIFQQGKKFLYRTTDQHMYCDGDDIWLYLVDRNEVQINDYDPDEAGGMITPHDLLRQYKSGMYEYQMVSDSKTKSIVEFKSTDEFDDYSKFRLTIDPKKNDLTIIEAFGKDGSRVYLKVLGLTPNQDLAAAIFDFDPTKYENILIEDLRID